MKHILNFLKESADAKYTCYALQNRNFDHFRAFIFQTFIAEVIAKETLEENGWHVVKTNESKKTVSKQNSGVDLIGKYNGKEYLIDIKTYYAKEHKVPVNKSKQNFIGCIINDTLYIAELTPEDKQGENINEKDFITKSQFNYKLNSDNLAKYRTYFSLMLKAKDFDITAKDFENYIQIKNLFNTLNLTNVDLQLA